MKLRIHRQEHLLFDAPVREHHLEWRCAPWDDAGQRLLSLSVSCTPAVGLASHRDCFGNEVHRTALLGAHDGLVLSMEATVETLLDDPFAFQPVPPEREREWLAGSLREAPRLWDLLLHRNAAAPLLDALLAGEAAADLGVDPGVAEGLPVPRAGTPLFAQLQDANSWISAACKPAAEAPGADTAPAADRPLREAAGGPTELALLLIAVARAWGLPARLVSGYRAETAQPRLSHWAEVLVPGAGWRGFDPAAGQVADGAYVRQAVGRNTDDLLALRQSWKGDTAGCEARTDIRVEPAD